MVAESFDVGPFWAELIQMLKFVRDRIRCGQTDVEGFKMDYYITESYKTLREKVVPNEKASKVPCRLFFWSECKQKLEPVFDLKTMLPKNSVGIEDFYKSLYQLYELCYAKPAEFWIQGKPKDRQFTAELPRARSRSPRRVLADGKWKCCGKTFGEYVEKCWKCGKLAPKTEACMGKQGVFSWVNPPRKLYEGNRFWIIMKSANWVCDTPENQEEFDRFVPKAGVDGHFTMWIREKYARQFPFLNAYDHANGINYGILQRLDRETSGPIVVCKYEDAFWTLKTVRDTHNWHKEYFCLVHGRIPPNKSEGVLTNYVIQKDPKKGEQYTRIVHGPWDGNQKAVTMTSIYRVERYYSRTANDRKPQLFTLVRVRIITGRTHQIRVHMQHLMSTLGDEKEDEACGIVSDFLYLDYKTSKHDQETVCPRVFLHERMLGMIDPEDESKVVCVVSPLPDDLEACLSKLNVDDRANTDLEFFRDHAARSGKVDFFAKKCNIGVYEKEKLREYTEPQQEEVIRAFSEVFDGYEGLSSLSMDGDLGFVFGLVLKDLTTHTYRIWDKQAGRWKMDIIKYEVEMAIETHIVSKMKAQGSNALANEVADEQPLPPGWKKMEVSSTGEVFYLHVRGRRETRRPVLDPNLHEPWIKLASTSRPGEYIYYNQTTKRSLLTPPTREDDLPAGWVVQKSRSDPNSKYFLHVDTGFTQFGFPCFGKPDQDLPENWEKVASSKPGGPPYYFNRVTQKAQYERPEDLPDGWQKAYSKTSGQLYYWHQATGKSQFEKPT